MSRNPVKQHESHIRPDGRAIAELKFSADALRTVRQGLVNLTYALGEKPEARGYLVLVEPTITESRLCEEWDQAKAVLKPELVDRLVICLVSADGHFRGIPEDPPPDAQSWLTRVIAGVATAAGSTRSQRTDFEFAIIKLLLYQRLTTWEPVTAAWLAQTAGCSYPTVARVVKKLGSIVTRESDRRLSLRYFPRDEYSRLLAKSERARSTTRFVDRSGQPRSPESHLRRLERLRPPDVAVGGVFGAKHYVPELDLIGAPRLDLSVHCPGRTIDTDFIAKLDPALRLEEDPRMPANIVVHAVRHADSLFAPRVGGLAWADPVECLLDLYESHLQAQASQFLDELEKTAEPRR